MIRKTSDVSLAALGTYDAIIDVRSPGEFAEDHLPGAINLPVLDDDQRVEIGTMYVQRSKFLARRTGAAYVARNIAGHLQEALADREGGFRPLVYCWRGGQRSTAMAVVMNQVGWPVTQLEGGYQTWRRHVVRALYEPAQTATGHPSLVLLDGYTGSGKTRMLGCLADRGVQMIDLEGLADHRGSLFGATTKGQPSQKLFESRLVEVLDRLDLSRPIVVEAESSRIGNLTLPPRLWAAMKVAPRIELSAPLDARVASILQDYDTIGTNAEALDQALRRLPRHHSREAIDLWRTMGREGRLAGLVEALLTAHYDPSYRRGQAKGPAPILQAPLPDLSPQSVGQTADRIAEAIHGLKRPASGGGA